MKTIKLKIKDFLNNELVNQIKIVGGDGPAVVIDPPPIGGPRVIGVGGGEKEPVSTTSNM